MIMESITTIKSHSQAGIALVLALLLLLVMTLLGVAAMGNINMQERMAGNANLQAQAFEAASAGVSNSINYVKLDAFTGFECGTTIADEDADVIIWGPTCWADPNSGECMEFGEEDEGVFLRQRMYCLKHPETARSQLFVLSRGEVRSGSRPVALRDIEVRLDIGSDGGTPAEDCTALCFPGGNANDIALASSNRFTIDGGITVGSPPLFDALSDAIENAPRGNYLPLDEPVIFSETMPSPWNDPALIWAFTEALREIAVANHASGCNNCYFENGFSSSGNNNFGTEANPQVTYVNGDLNLSGSPQGHGILIVNGDLSWRGAAQFYGLVIVLGESMTVTGGGNGGIEGSLILAPVGPSGGTSFGSIDLDFHSKGPGGAGGGTQLYKHDCDLLDMSAGLLVPVPDNPNPDLGLWTPGCESANENIFLEGPEDLIIASWRENIGWREEFVGSN